MYLSLLCSPATTTSSFSFGTGSSSFTNNAAPFSFGTTSAPQTQAGGFQIGSSTAPTLGTSFGFGSTTQAAPSFSFNSAPQNIATSSNVPSFGFGTSSTSMFFFQSIYYKYDKFLISIHRLWIRTFVKCWAYHQCNIHNNNSSLPWSRGH